MSARFALVAALCFLALGSAAAEQPTSVQPWYGMYIRPIRDAAGQRVLHVENVAKDGPAARAGIRIDDLITHVGSVPVDFGDEYELLSWLRGKQPGTRLQVMLIRGGRRLTVVLTIGTLPASARGSWERSLAIALRARAMRRAVSER